MQSVAQVQFSAPICLPASCPYTKAALARTKIEIDALPRQLHDCPQVSLNSNCANICTAVTNNAGLWAGRAFTVLAQTPACRSEISCSRARVIDSVNACPRVRFLAFRERLLCHRACIACLPLHLQPHSLCIDCSDSFHRWEKSVCITHRMGRVRAVQFCAALPSHLVPRGLRLCPL